MQTRSPTAPATPPNSEQQPALPAWLLESTTVAIASASLDLVITSWNPGAERLYGYTEAEAIGSPITMVVPPELRDEARKVLARAEAGEALEYETWRVRKDGSRVDVSLRIAPLRDSRGEIAGTVSVVSDISGRKIAEARLLESKALFREVFEQTPIGMVALGPDGRCLMVNTAMCQMTGYSCEQLVGSPFTAIVPEQEHDLVRSEIARLFADPSYRYQREHRSLTRGGREIWVNVGGAAVRGGDGAPQCVVFSVRDITEAKRAVDELALRAREQAAVAALGQRALAGSDPADLYDYVARLVADNLVCRSPRFCSTRAKATTCSWWPPLAGLVRPRSTRPFPPAATRSAATRCTSIIPSSSMTSRATPTCRAMYC